MTDNTPKLFVTYDTTIGQIWFDEIRTKTRTEIATEVKTDTDSKPRNWQVAKIRYIEPIEGPEPKIEVVGVKHFNLKDDVNKIKLFMVGVKAASKQEKEARLGLFNIPKCLDKKFKDDDCPYFIVEYFEGDHSGKFSVQNNNMDDISSRIEKDNSGEILYFDTVEEADKYIEKKMNFKMSIGDVVEKRFVIYNKETKEIATFSCDTSKLADLTELFYEGVSVSEIAKRLGISKNTVVGKINRFGLKTDKFLNQTEDYIKKHINKIRNIEICHGIFSSNNAAKFVAELLDLWTCEKDVWHVARLTQVDLNIYDKPFLPITLGNIGFKRFKPDLYELKHLLIVGRIGTGKTTLLKSILKSIEHQPLKANCKVVLIDTKNFDFNGYSSPYLMTPVIIDAVKAVEYLNQFQPSDEDVAIVIDELADLIAVEPDIQNILVNLAENPKTHLIVATRKYNILTNDFLNLFHNTISFNKIGFALYLSSDWSITKREIHFKTIFNKKEQ